LHIVRLNTSVHYTHPYVSLNLSEQSALLIPMLDVRVNRNIVHSGATDHVGQ